MPEQHPDQPADTSPETAPVVSIEQLPRELLWLLDAPLFINEKQVNAFYDAILRPDYEGANITLSDSITSSTSFGGTATVGANVPWLAMAQAQASLESSRGKGSGRDTTYNAVSNPYRHLLALALHYAADADLAKRLVVVAQFGETVKDGSASLIGQEWLAAAFISDLPRALVFLDVPKGGKLIPAAVELTDGEVHIVAEPIADQLGQKVREYPPHYPGSDATEEEKNAYYRWFSTYWDDRIALKILEATVKEHRAEWVAYNLPLRSPGGEDYFLHLHMEGNGEYATGTFAYNFITRAYNYGIRIVGTLKSGPDLNVLAIFES
jgi:hypothetical protein